MTSNTRSRIHRLLLSLCAIGIFKNLSNRGNFQEVVGDLTLCVGYIMKVWGSATLLVPKKVAMVSHTLNMRLQCSWVRGILRPRQPSIEFQLNLSHMAPTLYEKQFLNCGGVRQNNSMWPIGRENRSASAGRRLKATQNFGLIFSNSDACRSAA